MQNPFSSSDATNDIIGKVMDHLAQTFDNCIQRSKYFVFKATLPEFFPNLFDWIHFGCIWWNEINMDIDWDFKPL